MAGPPPAVHRTGQPAPADRRSGYGPGGRSRNSAAEAGVAPLSQRSPWTDRAGQQLRGQPRPSMLGRPMRLEPEPTVLQRDRAIAARSEPSDAQPDYLSGV